jgi:hypothetical protein
VQYWAPGIRGSQAQQGVVPYVETQCYSATYRSSVGGSGTGGAYVQHQLSWCSWYGVQITSASVYQTVAQSGWYTITGTYGPHWNSGPTGVSSASVDGYITWTFNFPFPFNNSGTTDLTSTINADGSSHQ